MRFGMNRAQLAWEIESAFEQHKELLLSDDLQPEERMEKLFRAMILAVSEGVEKNNAELVLAMEQRSLQPSLAHEV